MFTYCAYPVRVMQFLQFVGNFLDVERIIQRREIEEFKIPSSSYSFFCWTTASNSRRRSIVAVPSLATDLIFIKVNGFTISIASFYYRTSLCRSFRCPLSTAMTVTTMTTTSVSLVSPTMPYYHPRCRFHPNECRNGDTPFQDANISNDSVNVDGRSINDDNDVEYWIANAIEGYISFPSITRYRWFCYNPKYEV
jgi:hypothetical protein